MPADDDEASGPPPHPLDRLWFHPSELGSLLNASVDNQDDGLNNGSQGVIHVFSHDNGSTGNGSSNPPIPGPELYGLPEHAYMLMRPGVGIVYHNGREAEEFYPQRGFWPREGNPTALGNPNNDLVNLVREIDDHFVLPQQLQQRVELGCHLRRRDVGQGSHGRRADELAERDLGRILELTLEFVDVLEPLRFDFRRNLRPVRGGEHRAVTFFELFAFEVVDDALSALWKIVAREIDGVIRVGQHAEDCMRIALLHFAVWRPVTAGSRVPRVHIAPNRERALRQAQGPG